MMNFLQKIGFKNALLTLGALLILVMAVNDKCTREKLIETQAKLVRTEANLKAAQDTIRITKAKDNSVEYDKFTYIAKDIQELKKLNTELAKEVAITKGKVMSIQKQGFTVIHDTTYLNTTVDNRDGLIIIKGAYDTTFSKGNFRKLKTEATYNTVDSSATSKVTQDEIGFTAVTGLKETDKGYEIFVRPQYPGLKLTSLDGAVIEKNFFKQPKSKTPFMTFGVQVGWIPFTYDLTAKKGGLNLTQLGAGVGVQFNF